MQKNKKIGIGSYLKEHKFGIFLYCFVYVIASACGIFMTIIIANAIEQITLANYFSAITSFLLLIGLVLVQRVSWYLSGLIYFKISNKVMSKLSLDLAKQAFKLNSKTYAEHETGTFVQRIVGDPERVIYKLSDLVEDFTEVISALIILIYIISLNIYIGLILIGGVLVSTIIEMFRIKVYARDNRIVRKKNDKVNSLTTEIVRSEKDIKALGLEKTLGELSKASYDDYNKANAKLEITNMNFYSSRNLITKLVSLCALILGITMIDKGLITLSAFMIIYSNENTLFDLIWYSGNIFDSITKIKVSTNRMFALFDDNLFETEHFGTVKKDNFKGKIEFKKVGYSYTEYDDAEKKDKKVIATNQVLKDLSFKIKENTTVAFVGKSGSGKSTILNLIAKMIEVNSGEVLIDGTNINDLDKHSLRTGISLVSQFPYIFDMTIKENLLLAKEDATDEEIMSAINRASLGDFIKTLAKGIDTKIGESGVKLSGGQRQRLAIARALLRNSSIILFDESTSSLDNFAQEEVRKSIEALKGQSTIVIVAHRLSTIKDADTIFFIDGGKVVAEGSFDELFEHNALFKNMFYAENLN